MKWVYHHLHPNIGKRMNRYKSFFIEELINRLLEGEQIRFLLQTVPPKGISEIKQYFKKRKDLKDKVDYFIYNDMFFFVDVSKVLYCKEFESLVNRWSLTPMGDKFDSFKDIKSSMGIR